MKVIITGPARLNWLNILKYIANDNDEAATRMDADMKDAIERLVRFPKLGKPGRVAGTREFVFHANYIIVYKLIGQEIVIFRILHAAQQYP